MSSFPHIDLDHLSDQILTGDVVFFVGAGFSLDSEGNSGWRFVCRLLVRFSAITFIFREHGKKAEKELAQSLLSGLESTFDLNQKGPKDHLLVSEDNITKLSHEYYQINDWMCNAFTSLLKEFLKKPCDEGKIFELIDKINRTENELLAKSNNDDHVDFQPISIEHLLKVPDEGLNRGKMLFLDTMGFADENIMGGKPFAASQDEVVTSYADRLLPRYQVFARLAREGLCTTLLTTNYDLLLEGGFRLAGFQPKGVETDKTEDPAREIPLVHQSFSRIADPSQFFRYGEGHRAALIVKIHGCVENYRKHREDGTCGAYLPAMVFTYREIQNWREDSWSRDYVSTLLRTRSIVFCGYSVMDPVIHDTFRSVYEEMARAQFTSKGSKDSQDAPAFVIGTDDKKEFYGLEVLRAASRVIGVEHPRITEHPNYLQFDRKGPFPSSDELLLWIFHRTYRKLQVQAIKSDLIRAVTLVVGRPCAPADVKALYESFRQVTDAEQATAKTWKRGDDKSRSEMLRMIGWTRFFHPALLREFAIGEEILRRRSPGVRAPQLRKSQWYYPASQRPDWTAWGVVVEIALRRMLAKHRGKSTMWYADDPYVEVDAVTTDGIFPGVLFSESDDEPRVTGLGIFIGGYGRPRRRHTRKFAGYCSRTILWELPVAGHLWPREAQAFPASAEALWTCALGGDPPALDGLSPNRRTTGENAA